MQTGVYRKLNGHTGVGMFYLVLFPMREHTTGEEAVAYVPLRVEPEWAGTLRVCYQERKAFEAKFEYVAEGLPDAINPLTQMPMSPAEIAADWKLRGF